jgi:propionyl-CoA carboxylase beta chain
MKTVVESVLDRHQFYEIMPNFAKNIIVGFGDVKGQVVGIVGN